MKDKHRTKFVTKDIFKCSVIGAFTKLNPKYMMHNPVMFVVEIGFVIALLLSIFPELFGPTDGINNVRLYNIFVCVILFVTVLFANFAEAVAEGRGKAQAESLKKTQKDTKARLLKADGTETVVSSSELKKGDVVMVSARSSPTTARSSRAPPAWMSPPSPASPPPCSVSPAATSPPSPAAPPWCPTG